MTGVHQPLALDHEDLNGLEAFDVAGKIPLHDGDLSYSKVELSAYWVLRGRSDVLVDVVSHQHRLECIVSVRVGQDKFTLLYHTGSAELPPPSSVMPHVMHLHEQTQLLVGHSVVAIFADPGADYAKAKACLHFLIENVIGNRNDWSLSSIARDFSVADSELPSSGYGLLLSDAFRAGRLKYAYLDLFRCIEHKALRHAQDRFVSEFLDDPKRASEDVLAVVRSEKKLYSQVITANAAVIAGASEVIENVRRANSYLGAVIGRMEEIPADPNTKSTHIMYAVRNSIAHAKAGDLMVERYSDYEFALSQIVPYVEILALRFAGIELDAPLY
jgi:hypothetical protein